MMQKVVSVLVVSWCVAFMIVLGTWLPKMIEAPYPPSLEIAEAKVSK
jgi:hypothetical protein